MTVIVATPHFMAADRRVTDDGVCSSLVKIAKNKHLIAAASGNGTSCLAVKRAIQRGATQPEDLISCVDKDSYALVLTPDRKILQIQAGMIWPPGATPCAIGSGADLALGFLAGCGSSDREAVRRALRFVSKRRNDCGGGTDFRTFD